MKLISWLFVSAAGLAIMSWAYFAYERLDPAAPWSSGLIVVGDGLRDGPATPIPFRHLPATVRELPPSLLGDTLLQAFGRQGEARKRNLAAQLCEKLLLLDPKDAGIGQEQLLSGRLPRAGSHEVLAGCQTTARDRLAVAGQEFAVVGVLRRDVALFVDCYLVPPHDSVASVFDARDAATHPALLLELTAAEMRDHEVRDELKGLFPRDQFAAVGPLVRPERGPYYLYLAGEALLLWGGSLALLALYRRLLPKAGWSVFRDPLAELAARPKLIGTLHLVYFGLVIAASAIVYNVPELQTCMLPTVRQAFDPQGPLGVISRAVSSQNIPLTAALIFVVNFFGGSLLVITVPSLIVPGSGMLMAVIRSTVWGLILAPSFVVLSCGMIPHSGTLLLEGEGYIQAAFFGLLVPIYLCERDKGSGVWQRYGQALLMNLKAMPLVAAVLAVAACYEAVEVILMSR